MVAALIGVKAILLLLNWRFSELAGLWKLSIASGLTLVAGVLTAMINGVPFFGALTNAGTLALFSVFLNQVYRQAKNLQDDRKQPPPVSSGQ